jgi:hypothetical protein
VAKPGKTSPISVMKSEKGQEKKADVFFWKSPCLRAKYSYIIFLFGPFSTAHVDKT